MFSRIIETLGTVRARTPGRIDVVPRTPFANLETGESLAGQRCLSDGRVGVQRGLRCRRHARDPAPHRLGALTGDATVNLERALHFGDRVGGHRVSGHVDGTGIVTALREDANARRVTIATPGDLIDLVAEKGCIAVDGVSLTVVDVFEAVHGVAHSGDHRRDRRGRLESVTQVNLVVDLIARYVARTLSARERGGFVATSAIEG